MQTQSQTQTLRERTLSATITTPSGTVAPAFVRMPPPNGACPLTGLKRGALYALAREGKIKTATIRRKGSNRGIRLINVASLLAYVNECQDAPDATETEELVED